MKEKHNLPKIKQQVKYILETNIAARSSDAILYKILAKTFYDIDLSGIDELPSLEGVSRARRHFQEQGQYSAEDCVVVARAEYRKEYKKEYSP